MEKKQKDFILVNLARTIETMRPETEAQGAISLAQP